jgi:glutathione S-transferase
MQLYYFETPNPRKVCATAKHLGLPLDYVKLNAAKLEHRSPAHLARNPNGKVPVLVDGETHLWESAAIMAYLAAKTGSDMWPAGDAVRQAEIMRWVMWDAFNFTPKVGQIYYQRHIKPKFGLGVPDEAAIEAAAPGLHSAAKLLDAHLAGREYVAGRNLSIADFCLAATLPHAEEIRLPLEPYGNIRRWHDGLMKIPAWRDPWPA